MDYELPEELRMMKETLRRFIDKEVSPIEREAYDGPEMVPEIRQRLQARAQELGFWMIDVPEKFGGMGLGLLTRVLVWEEAGRTIAFPRRKPWTRRQTRDRPRVLHHWRSARAAARDVT